MSLCDKTGRPLHSISNYPLPKVAETVIVKPKHKYKKRQRSCAECKVSDLRAHTGPMLRDEIWSTIAGKKDLLCFECIEVRLGREIVITDLNNSVMNYGFRKIYERSHVCLK